MRSLVLDRFSPVAAKLRAEFDAKLRDPRKSGPGRFVWDYWHVPGQYTHLRTPAEPFFSPRAFAALIDDLVGFGQRELGCHGISPPWLSNYVEGCEQQLHADVPHGPWAYVLSLSPPRRAFRGGETLLLRDEILDYWSERRAARLTGGFVERDQVVERVAPDFGRLIVFDPRIPHGVSRVEGTHDPREGRLVLHGWFVQPRPFIEGPLRAAALERLIGDLTAALAPRLTARLEGMLSVRFGVSAAGRISAPRVLASQLRSLSGGAEPVSRFLKAWLPKYAGLVGRAGRGKSVVTLPLVFD